MRILFKFLFAALALIVLMWLHAAYPGLLFLMAILLFVSVVYIIGLIRLWRKVGFNHGIPIWRASCFLMGMLILTVALSAPIDTLADHAFSVHMVQHMLLIKVVAPLLLLGNLSIAWLWTVGPNLSHQLARMWNRSHLLQALWKRLLNPWVAWSLFALSLWIWHVPAFYQAALKSEPLHDFEHLLFLSSSLLFWWYLIQNGRDSRVRYGTAVLYLFTTLLHESALGALLTFSSRSWYSSYTSPGVWGLSPLSDQQLAGMIMWLLGGILFMFLIVYYFGSWIQAIEKRMPIPQAELAQSGDRNE